MHQATSRLVVVRRPPALLAVSAHKYIDVTKRLLAIRRTDERKDCRQSNKQIVPSASLSLLPTYAGCISFEYD